MILNSRDLVVSVYLIRRAEVHLEILKLLLARLQRKIFIDSPIHSSETHHTYVIHPRCRHLKLPLSWKVTHLWFIDH